MFAGITVMFGVGALLAPQVGRLIDRTGARTIMASGSALYAVSLAALAFSQGLVSYLLVLGGDGHRLDLGAQHAVQHRHGPGRGTGRAPRHRHAGHHRRLRLDRVLATRRARSTWRWAGAARCWSMPRSTSSPACPSICWCCRASRRRTISPRAADPAASGVPSEVRSRAFLLLSVTLSSGAFVFTGAMVHMIELMRGLGHPAAVGGVPGLADRPLAGHGAHVRAAVRPSLLDHELGGVRLGDAGRWGWPWP